MAALQHLTSILFCIATTAATYLVMHLVVAPRLPVAAVEVPPLHGLTVEQARAMCDPRGLLLVIDGERVPESSAVAAGTLFDQHPLGGSRLRPGDKVHVTLARAVPPRRVPALSGQPLEQARRLLEEQGLGPGTVVEEASETVVAGAVIRSHPEAGTEVRPGQPIELVVSRGSDKVVVPNLRGRSVRAAQKLLEQAGLELGGQQRGVDDNLDDGVILRQSPAAGTQVPRGHKVDVVVNE
ncbi:MAG: PASTA domain-containing protein [Myxococcales bacterium]|nr:PASTA domain-containing protein [Myxococcota bacterium]MDW8280512.1 PASTA domain-containing protein [Myxococcales bacterium]